MKRISNEKGQALVLIVLAAVGLFAFAALAIDGGRVFSDRRHAQNTADTAVMAAALAEIRTQGSATAKFNAAVNAARVRASSNGYNNNGALGVVVPNTNVVIVELCNNTTISNRPCEGMAPGAAASEYIRVYIVSYLPTTFARVIGRATVTNGVDAIARTPGSSTTSSGGGSGYGITTLGQGCVPNSEGLKFTGSGPVTIDGSIGDNACFDASGSSDFHVTGNIQIGNSFNHSGSGDWNIGGYVWVNGFNKSGSGLFSVVGSFFSDANFTKTSSGNFSAGSLSVVGTANVTGTGTVTPWPPTVGSYQSPALISDPFASSLNPPPDPGGCTALSFGGSTDQTINPGCYTSITRTGSGSLTLNPGVYYLKGDFTTSGSGALTANGVMIYMQSGELRFSGSGGLSVSPMTSGLYRGLSVYMDRANSDPISMSGSGGSTFIGTVYAPASSYTANGSGGSFILDSQVICSRAEFTGSGALTLSFSPANNFAGTPPASPSIQLIK